MHSIAWWPTLLVVAMATVTDLRSRRIPNWLVLPFLGAGLLVSVWLHGWHGAVHGLEGMALGLVLFGALFLAGGMGAGDVKLCAAIGAWIGPQQLFLALIFTALAGGLMALVWAACGGFLGDLMKGTGDLVLGRKQRDEDPASTPEVGSVLKRHMPYAPAIAIGTLMSFFAR